MADESSVRYEMRGPAAWITLAAPATRNALSGPMIEALGAGLARAMDDPAVRVVVLTGDGPAFCAGADLKAGGAAVAPGAGQRNPFVEVLQSIWDGPKPVIVARQRACLRRRPRPRGGRGHRHRRRHGRVRFSEVRVGVIPAMISVVVLPKVGVQQTMRLFLTGRAVRRRAKRSVTACSTASCRPTDSSRRFRRRSTPSRRAVRRPSPRPSAWCGRCRGCRWTRPSPGRRPRSPSCSRRAEAAEGMAAFAEKRKPSWVPGGAPGG